MNAPHGNQDPLVKDEKRQDLLDIEQTIARIREELHDLVSVQNQRAEFGLDDFSEEFEQLPTQDAPQDPPVVDNAPPAVIDANAQKLQVLDQTDDQLKAKQADPQDPPAVADANAPQDPPAVIDGDAQTPKGSIQKMISRKLTRMIFKILKTFQLSLMGVLLKIRQLLMM